ncbi:MULTISPECIES: TIGR01777 family oxidoreductase [Pseudofrankia]|uniref:TIGR01777 family oxidoreductase n=1 Tax=Pseudofrankia TaxID=2994363 RepID=UPI000234B25D|nr:MULTISPECIES: TIGR01777 family oxidoreductase [Pseudofrankia]OHV29731.1 TIGR01777 family protein [Pseudofrankia sp. EUN1h]
MRIIVTGASGLLGSELVPALRADGHDVATLVRREPRGPGEFRWDPARGELDDAALVGVDAAVHLAGAGVGDHRWTADYRRAILDSRVQGTRLLAGALAASAGANTSPAGSAGSGSGSRSPAVLLSASGVGWYGTAADDEVDETAPAGGGFLADVVRAWEEATVAAVDAGLRVCLLRTGPVFARQGGVLARQLPLFRVGLGGRLGSGRQWLAWIGIDDWVAAVRFLLAADGSAPGEPRQEAASRVAGPVNLVSPNPVTGAEFARTLGGVLHRPALLPVPRFALRAVVGGFTDEGVLASQRVVPRVLLDAGFHFQYPDLAGALRATLTDQRS